MIPRLADLGAQNYEARELVGKWAYSVEDYARAELEFAAAKKLRSKIKPKPAPDLAVSYLRGLICSLNEQYKKAVAWLEEAASLAPDYGLFRFKLAENRLYLGQNPADSKIVGEFLAALELLNDTDGQMAFYAGNLYVTFGNDQNAAVFFNKAMSASPDNEKFFENYYRCLMRLKKYSEAEELLLQFQKRDPSVNLSPLLLQNN